LTFSFATPVAAAASRGDEGVDARSRAIAPRCRQNLYGTIYFVSAVAPHMKQQKAGRIVTVSSISGLAPSMDGGYAHYGAAKAAIAHYTRYLARELAPFRITDNIALRRQGTVEDCAKVIEFLCTDLSDYVTGTIIPIDGGTLR